MIHGAMQVSFRPVNRSIQKTTGSCCSLKGKVEGMVARKKEMQCYKSMSVVC